MNKKLPLLAEVLKYHDEKNLLLSMPGNKGGRGFLIDKYGRKFAENMGFIDITEVDPLDNFQCPKGVIKEAQNLLAKTYNCKKAYFLVNGSSSGNMISIFSAFNEKDHVAIERNCHKSIYNASILRKLKVTYIDCQVDKDTGIPLPPNENQIFNALKKDKKIKGVILTYPSYYGITYDIRSVIKKLKEKEMKVIVDSAHGAHFGLSKNLPDNISDLADYTVLSAHKTLPALTQSAYLAVNDLNSNVEFYIGSFISTSPSYILMSSLDYARYYMDTYAKKDYENLITLMKYWKDKINNETHFNILSKDDLKIYGNYDVDLSRYVVVTEKGYSGHKLLKYLREKKIQCEMSFERGVVLIFSPFNDNNDFKKVFNALLEIDINKIKENHSYFDMIYKIHEKKLEPYEVFSSESEFVFYKNAIGKVLKESIVPYPPGIPLVCAGEVLNEADINIIDEYVNNNKDIIGVYDKKVNILK
ncbi:aminotransferase class I/II-fold pyridoxal phosphate-dependent enzyme [Clostridium sp. BJN0001]|uniref:aminotransferase class I/II-fold pyridoxal phosphate-dependent enzyme n=1 Tax=Clostridium sp. BJN0001 TaxID=2930219 RepID=UPI001FD278F5|nr:aminotransferase class I/II-fold pyridoxal phosphate-dependent enzyme [Clostridium sp. BJN0001]